MNDLTRTTITSMEAAEWCGKDHAKLLRDIRNYISQLGEAKIGFTDFFKESNVSYRITCNNGNQRTLINP